MMMSVACAQIPPPLAVATAAQPSTAGPFRQTYAAEVPGSDQMPSTDDLGRPRDARAVAERYRRYERPLSALVAAAVMIAFLATFLATSPVAAVAVAAVLLVVVRAPLFETRGTVRLETDASPGAVVDAFTSPTPPVLAFQWGIADAVSADGDGDAVTYEVSYLFGLRSVAVTVTARTDADTDDGERTVDLEITANGAPWATYAVRVARADDRTVVTYDYEADRRFGLRRLPQRFLVRRYRDAALAAQGYTVVDRDSRIEV